MLIPLPPEEDSVAFMFDQEIAAKYLVLEDVARKEQATQDAVLAFTEAVNAFNNISEVQISGQTNGLGY